MEISITKKNGSREPFNADRVNQSIERACKGLMDPISMVMQIATETQLTLYDGITTEEMDQATINAALQNIKDDIAYDKVATRLLLKTIYRKVLPDYDKDDLHELKVRHRDGFVKFVTSGVADGKLDPRMLEKFDLKELAATLDVERDELFQYAGLSTFLNRYALKDMDQEPRETPQYFFMRVAMGLSYNEADATHWAKKFYHKMSHFEYIAGGSTNLGAGTNNPALSNCFLLEIHDDMNHIAKSVSDVMLLSKGSGGIGASMTKLRAAGSPLKSNNGVSTGPTPFAKIIDTAIRAIQRGGKKKGALCFYMENWHIDFPEFIDWKHNAGDDYMRMRTANTAAFISDEFMLRVKANADWYLFDPIDTPDLPELYGKAFSKRYAEYIEMAEAKKLRTYKKMPATELFRNMLVSLQTTSHPWITWKDTINLRALNNNTGTIHMSNLCTEICLPQDKDNIAVCNLASLNLAVHVVNKEVNWGRLEDSVRCAIRQLDNLIDINVLPVPEAVKSDRENRAVGLGVMGLADAFEKIGLPYDSQAAFDFTDRIFEFISYMAIDESANLAQERGSYTHFQGSEWSKGHVPIDTLARIEESRGDKLTVSPLTTHKGLNWKTLRAKVAKGMRNATLLATAPNANIGLVAATTPGMDPRFAQVFSRNKISGKYMDINHNLVKDLMNLGLWEKVKEQIIGLQGDISTIEEIPDYIKSIYRTSFTTSPYAFIEVAARAQKWIDQGISRNMYLDTRDIDEIMKIYTTAWEKGVKTTYYLHMKPRHTAEQSTVHVNKSSQTGKVGFGAIKRTVVASTFDASPVETVAEVGPTDPFAAGDFAVSVAEEAMAMPTPVSTPVAASHVASQTAVPAVGFGAIRSHAATHATEAPVSPSATAPATPASPTASVASSASKYVPIESLVQNMPVSSPMQTATASFAKPTVIFAGAKTCPTDPAELAQCDSCQ